MILNEIQASLVIRGLVIHGFDYPQLVNPPANGANERSEICVVSRGGNFFKQ